MYVVVEMKLKNSFTKDPKAKIFSKDNIAYTDVRFSKTVKEFENNSYIVEKSPFNESINRKIVYPPTLSKLEPHKYARIYDNHILNWIFLPDKISEDLILDNILDIIIDYKRGVRSIKLKSLE